MTKHQAPEVTSELRECPWCGGPATVIVTDCRPCKVDGWTDAYSVWCNASVLCGGPKPNPYILGLIGACIGLLGLNVWNWWFYGIGNW